MPLFRTVDGRFFDIPEEQLERLEVEPERMEGELRETPVVGVEVPQDPAAEALPSDIKFAHYGTTTANPHWKK